MSKIIAILLILAGGWLIYTGYAQADSMAGRTKTALVELKNEIDGKGRTPKQYAYYGSGALLVALGAVLLLRKR